MDHADGRAAGDGRTSPPPARFEARKAGLPFLFFLGGSLVPIASVSLSESCAVWSTERFPDRRLVLDSAGVWPAAAWVGTGEVGLPFGFLLGASLAPLTASSPESCTVWSRARFPRRPAVQTDVRALMVSAKVTPKPGGWGQWVFNLGNLGRVAHGGWPETSDFPRARLFRGQRCDESGKESSLQEPGSPPSHCRRLQAREENWRQWEA